MFALLLPAAACAGRAVTKSTAQKLLVSLPSGVFDKEDLEILSVSQTGARDAIVETTVRAAFKIEKVEGEWIVREVRIGNHEWEDIEEIAEAARRAKVERTRGMLEAVAASLDRYREKNGRLPAFKDYVALSDALHPAYQPAAIRLDAWRRPLVALLRDGTAVHIISVGPDGTLGTADDIVVVRDYPH